MTWLDPRRRGTGAAAVLVLVSITILAALAHADRDASTGRSALGSTLGSFSVATSSSETAAEDDVDRGDSFREHRIARGASAARLGHPPYAPADRPR